MKTKGKTPILPLLFALSVLPHLAAYAQEATAPAASTRNPLSAQTQVEVGLGFATPFLRGGGELERAKVLREGGLSYYQGDNGDPRNVGSYRSLAGWSVSTAFYKPLRRVKGLMLGSAFRLCQTGSEPAEGGYAEGYYFNYVSVGPALKYYPFARNNFFLKGEAGLAAVLTKNRFLNSTGAQNFFHQFGIGTQVGLGAGYSLTPFSKKQKSLDIQVGYGQFATRVEVNGVGNDRWRFGAFHAGLSLSL